MNVFSTAVPWATILVVIAAIAVIAVGAVVVITGDMTYETYLDNLVKFAPTVGLLAIGKGLHKIGANNGN